MAYLLDAGADITATDEHAYTALHLASYYGRVGVVALLLRLERLLLVGLGVGRGQGRKDGGGRTVQKACTFRCNRSGAKQSRGACDLIRRVLRCSLSLLV